MIEWNKLVDQPEKLAKYCNKSSASQVARDYGLSDHKAVTYHLKKHNYECTNGTWHKQDVEVESEPQTVADDERIKIKETEDGYTVTHPKGTFKTTEQQLNDLRFYYAEMGLTKDEAIRKLKKDDPYFDYDKLIALKKTFHIVHDSLPYQQETIKNNDAEKLADELLQREEQEFIEVYQTKKLRKLEKENKKLRKKKYVVHEVSKELLPEVQQMKYEPPQFEYIPPDRKCDYQIMNVDWHVGKKVFADVLLGNPKGYNKDIFEDNIDAYLNEIIYGIKTDKPENIYIVDLGDTADGRKIYEEQAQGQDLYGYKQCVKAADVIEYFIKTIHGYNPNITYIRVPGNHQRNDDSDILIGKLVERGMRNYDEIEFDVSEEEYKTRTIRGINHIYTHGQHIRKGTYTRANDVFSIIQMMGYEDKYTYVHQGHLHHLAKEGARHNHWKWPSMVGGDWLSNNAMQEGARPSQVFLRLTEQGISSINPVYFD